MNSDKNPWKIVLQTADVLSRIIFLEDVSIFLTMREALFGPFQEPFENRSLRGSPNIVLDESLSREGS